MPPCFAPQHPNLRDNHLSHSRSGRRPIHRLLFHLKRRKARLKHAQHPTLRFCATKTCAAPLEFRREERGDGDVKDLFSGYVTALDQEPPLKTLGKKLIINVAHGVVYIAPQNPRQPCTMGENVEAVSCGLRSRSLGLACPCPLRRRAAQQGSQGGEGNHPPGAGQSPDIITSVISYADYTARVWSRSPLVSTIRRRPGRNTCRRR